MDVEVENGESVVLLMQGSSASGKSHTLEGRFRAGDGLVPLIFRDLCARNYRVAARFIEVKRADSRDGTALANAQTFDDSVAAQEWYRLGCARRAQVPRKTIVVGHINSLGSSKGGTSSRSWSELSLVSAPLSLPADSPVGAQPL